MPSPKTCVAKLGETSCRHQIRQHPKHSGSVSHGPMGAKSAIKSVSERLAVSAKRSLQEHYKQEHFSPPPHFSPHPPHEI